MMQTIESRQKTLFGIGLLSATLAVVTAYISIPQFASVFREFDVRLPLVTKLLVQNQAWSFVGLVAVALAWFALRNSRHRGLTCLLIGIASPLAVVISVYVPVFQMASAV